MTQHIFLTGKKQVGKSTLIKKILQSYTGTIGGFFTIRTNSFLRNSYSVHLLCADTNAKPDATNMLFICGKSNPHTHERFDQLGCKALILKPETTLIIMDELGPNESDAASFRQAVLHTLDGEIPVIGVLQEAASTFLDEIVHHPKVHVLRITEENRNLPELFDEIQSRIILKSQDS